MDNYKIGDQVYAKLGAFPVIGTVIAANAEMGKYLIRFSVVQQNWYAEEELRPYQWGQRGV